MITLIHRRRDADGDGDGNGECFEMIRTKLVPKSSHKLRQHVVIFQKLIFLPHRRSGKSKLERLPMLLVSFNPLSQS